MDGQSGRWAVLERAQLEGRLGARDAAMLRRILTVTRSADRSVPWILTLRTTRGPTRS